MYYGGKWLIAPWIISFFPKHNNYLEPCGGAASVLIQKPKSKLETFNDIDGNVCNFFRVLRDNPNELIRKIKLTPWAREEFEVCRKPSEDPIENARRFYLSSFMAISKKPFDKSTGMTMTSYANQIHTMTGHNCKWENFEYLYSIAKRFEEVQIENREAEYVIERYDKEDTLIYFDPPYVASTRTTKKHYHYEVDDSFHINLSELLNNAKGYVVVSGYSCDLYKTLYEDKSWIRYDKEFLGNSGAKRVESIWLSPRTIKDLNKPSKRKYGV